MVKEKGRAIHEEKEKKFQKYRNKINDLLRISKQFYYNNSLKLIKKPKSFMERTSQHHVF